MCFQEYHKKRGIRFVGRMPLLYLGVGFFFQSIPIDFAGDEHDEA